MTDYECELAKAEQGEAKAQHNLGVMYRIGHGVPQDYKAALKWFRLAAEQGLAKAQGNLGQMYDEGKGACRCPVYARCDVQQRTRSSTGL